MLSHALSTIGELWGSRSISAPWAPRYAGVQVSALPPGNVALSFRIRAASAAAVMRYTAARISQLGRWHSAAFQSYVHPVQLTEVYGF